MPNHVHGVTGVLCGADLLWATYVSLLPYDQSILREVHRPVPFVWRASSSLSAIIGDNLRNLRFGVRGLIAAGVTHARQLEHLELDSVISVPMLDRTFFAQQEETAAADPYAARVGMVALRGSFTVASSHKLASTIGADIKDHEVVIFDFSQATYVDDSAAMVIKQLLDIATEEQTEFIVMGLAGSVAKTLHALNILRNVPEDRIVKTLDEARQAAKDLLDD